MNLNENNHTGFNVFLKLLALPSEVFTLHSFTTRGIHPYLLGIMWVPWFLILVLAGSIIIGEGQRTILPANGFAFLFVATLIGLYHYYTYLPRARAMLATADDDELDAEPTAWIQRFVPEQANQVRKYIDPLIPLVVGYAAWAWLGSPIIGLMLILSGLARELLAVTSRFGREYQLSKALWRQQHEQEIAEATHQSKLDLLEEFTDLKMADVEAQQQWTDNTLRDLEAGKQANTAKLTGRKAATVIGDSYVPPARIRRLQPKPGAAPVAPPAPEESEPIEGSFRAAKLKRQQSDAPTDPKKS